MKSNKAYKWKHEQACETPGILPDTYAQVQRLIIEHAQHIANMINHTWIAQTQLDNNEKSEVPADITKITKCL